MDIKARYKLVLIGITYNQIENGVYALILQQEGGTRRIPIIIGTAEAQSIECKLQNIIPPRPLTHDLMVNVMRAYGIALEEVEIRRLPNGVFAATLALSDGSRQIKVDSRSSDAVAMAIRFGVPIYTTGEVLLNAGFESETEVNSKEQLPNKNGEGEVGSLELFTVKRLNEMLSEAVEKEQYELAAKIKTEIERRNLNI